MGHHCHSLLICQAKQDRKGVCPEWFPLFYTGWAEGGEGVKGVFSLVLWSHFWYQSHIQQQYWQKKPVELCRACLLLASSLRTSFWLQLVHVTRFPQLVASVNYFSKHRATEQHTWDQYSLQQRGNQRYGQESNCQWLRRSTPNHQCEYTECNSLLYMHEW